MALFYGAPLTLRHWINFSTFKVSISKSDTTLICLYKNTLYKNIEAQFAKKGHGQKLKAEF